MSQNIAKAIGPAVTEMMGTFAAAVQVAAEYVEKNKDAMTGFVKGVLDFIKAAIPFAGAIGVVIGVMKAWRLATLAVAKAQLLVKSLMGPKGIALAATGLLAYKKFASDIDGLNKGISSGMEDIEKRAKELKKEFKEKVLGLGDGEGIGAALRLKNLEDGNEELKRSEKLALAQAKALYGPQTQEVISARIKLAQAERESAIAQQKANLKDGADQKLNKAATEADNAQKIAAEEAAKTIADAYKEARDAAGDAADALGEARSKRANQLFNRKSGINQFLGGTALRSRQREGIKLQVAEAARLRKALVESFKKPATSLLPVRSATSSSRAIDKSALPSARSSSRQPAKSFTARRH